METPKVMQAKVSTKGWVVIPAVLRRRYGLKPGTIVNVEDTGERIVIYPTSRASYKKARGMLAGGASLAKELLAERAQDLEREEARIRA